MPWRAPDHGDGLDSLNDFVSVDAVVDMYRQGFASELVDRVEQLQTPPSGGLVKLKVQRPHMARAHSAQPDGGAVTEKSAFVPPMRGPLKAMSTPQTQRALGIGSTARVAPPGGSRPLLGTNPIAMAVPGPSSEVAFQFDFSTSAVALGKITMAATAGTAIPTGWAVDENGNDTTDPEAALRGSLLSAGGYKGYGFGLMVEVLAAALTGTLASVDVPPLKAPDGPPHDLGQFYLLIDPGSFSGDAFWESLSQLAERVDEQPGARLPGTAPAPADSVSVDSELWATVVGLSRTP